MFGPLATRPPNDAWWWWWRRLTCLVDDNDDAGGLEDELALGCARLAFEPALFFCHGRRVIVVVLGVCV